MGTDQKEKKQRFKVRAIQMLGGSCEHCGLEYDGTNASVFDCHHKNPETKGYNISRLTHIQIPIELKDAEIMKCSLLCSNCHRLLHHGVY